MGAIPPGPNHYSVLGPMEVHRAGQLVSLNAPMLRRLLALLVHGVGQPVSSEQLACELWPNSQPSAARKTLHVYVRRLRQVLGQDSVCHGPAGYALVVGPEQVDALRFNTLVALGLASRTAGQLQVSAARLDQALRLWRGEAYANLALPALDAEVQRLSEQLLLAREEYAEVRLDLNRHDELVPELAELCALHPYRERLTACRMLALYRRGQSVRSLEVYRECARTLTDDLGVEPSPVLSRLHQAILNDDPILSRRTVREILRSAGAGAGAERSRGTEPIGVGPRKRQAPSHIPVPRQLPANTPVFAGRLAALAELDRWTRQDGVAPPIVVISGAAGVGKTALAVYWAHQAQDRFPDGHLYVNLEGFSGRSRQVAPLTVIRRLIEDLGIRPDGIPPDPQAQGALFRSLLATRRMLVVLDNARDTDQVRELLPGSSTVTVLITSRNQLSPLVAVHGARPIALDVLSPEESREILVRRLGRQRVEAESPACDEIIATCAGLPLALNIAAARAQQSGFPLGLLASELHARESQLDVFDAGDTTTRVRTVFSWSYDVLTAEAARLFRLLGTHPGPAIGSAAATALLGGASPVVGPLTELTRASLLTEHEPGRYSFHDLLRAYAVELAQRHDGERDRDEALVRLLDHYVHTAHSADRLLAPHREESPFPPGPPPVDQVPPGPGAREEAKAWFAIERPALLALVRRAAATGHDAQVWQLAWAMNTHLFRQGRWDELTVVWTAAIEAATRLEQLPAVGTAHRCLAGALIRLTRHAEAKSHLTRALEAHTLANDVLGQAYAHYGIAYWFGCQGQVSTALEYSTKVLTLTRAARLPTRWQANALNSAGWCHAQLGDLTMAAIHCERALALFRELGDEEGEAATWDSLGLAYHQSGRHSEAIGCYQRALSLIREVGDHYVEAAVLAHLGDTHQAIGKPISARTTWQRALDILTALDHPRTHDVRTRLETLSDLDER